MELPITGHTKLTALLGKPVAHSLSPLMHNEAFHLLGLDYVYLCFEVDETALSTAVAGLKAAGIRGFNLTMPNKNKIMEFLDDLSPAAKMIGAVNTVVNDNGKLTGHNTDGTGFMRSAADAGFSLKGKSMTLLGAGGAATAIAAQAALDGMKEIRIFLRPASRFFQRISHLTDTINRTTDCRAAIYDNADTKSLKNSLETSDILVNATSVGMEPDTQNSLITDISMFPKELAVADIIYEPRKTRLLSLAESAGCPTMNGLYMLLYQGAEAFRLFTGKEMPVEPIKEKFFSR
ncbi:MAG: shikimate dehydrogenase [Ruminococcus sp.]|jgi:shikimate dehydrogenase